MAAEADDLDRASDLAAQRVESTVSDLRRLAQPEQVCVDGVWPHTECVDCDLEIPDGRLAMGKVRCIGCQERLERRRAGL